MRARALTASLLMSATALAGPPRAALTTVAADTPEVLLIRGKQAYDHQDYAGAIKNIEPIIVPTAQVASDAEPDARKRLAVSYFMQKETSKAEQQFQVLLQLDPDFHLSDVVDPPSALAFFNEIRKKNDELLIEQNRRLQIEKEREAERKRKEEEERIRRSMAPDTIERTIEKHYFLVNFVPFGLGQFQNGERKKGYLMLTSQAAFAAASIALWGAVLVMRSEWAQGNAAMQGTRPTHEERATAVNLSIAYVALGAAFWLDVAVGIFDAIRNYKPEIVVEKKIPGRRGTVSVAPFIAPAAGGLSIQGAF